MGRLKGKVAVVTGAASGFGEGMAKRYAEEGAKIKLVWSLAAAMNIAGDSQVNNNKTLLPS